MSEPVVDLQNVRREIEAEVRARRATGEYPPGFDSKLDELFARFSPPEASDDFDAAVERAEEAVAIDLVIPVASNKPGIGLFKRVVAKLIGWYHAFIVQQVSALGAAITHAVRLLGMRVDQIERSAGHSERARVESARVPTARDDATWNDAVVRALDACRGRVAVCEAGDGALLRAVVHAGLDAYGVEPRFDLADGAIATGLEVRIDDAVGHLRSVAPGELEAVVLRGCVERLPVGEVLDLVDLATARLAPGGRLVIASLSPAGWGRGRTEIEADLAPGRPLHAATWTDLFTARGFEVVTSEQFATNAPITELPATHPDASTLNHALARISAELFGPDAYVVAGRLTRA